MFLAFHQIYQKTVEIFSILKRWEYSLVLKGIQRKQTFRLTHRRVSRGGTSATQRQKFHTEDLKSVRNPVRSAYWTTEQLHCFSYCLRMTDKRQKATKVKCKRDESLTKQSILFCGIQSSLEQAFEFCWSLFTDEHNTHNTLPKSIRRNLKWNKFTFGTP